MLSRLANTAVRINPASTVRVLSTSNANSKAPVIIQDGPERDLVNFPRRKRQDNCDPVRLKFIPDSWFTFFHEKTGVSGPYVFLGTFGTFLASKELWILDHEFFVSCVMFVLFGYGIKRFGPDVRTYLEGEVKKTEGILKAIRQDEIDRCAAAIDGEVRAQEMASSFNELIQAKRENVALQLEAEYRQRLQDAYNMVKRRLDYQLETSNVMRRVEQRHMVDWIMDNVKKGISAKQEEDALKKCIQDLKSLSTA